MPNPGHAWWHLILHTKGSWLHGDPRGFRSRNHRIHSNGDYKNLPPDGEHQRLYDHQESQLKNAIIIPDHLLPTLGQRLHSKCIQTDTQVLAISVGSSHAHLLVQYLNQYEHAQNFAAKLKQAASHAVRNELAGSIWARGGKPILIQDRQHQQKVFHYILEHASTGDWT